MIYPIVLIGDPVLKKRGENIPLPSSEIEALIEDMFETMYQASGVGLAAPQIGKSLRLFVIDSTPMMDEKKNELGLKKSFINPVILEEAGKEWPYEEGCLSIPGIHEDVVRKEQVTLQYQDLQGVTYTETFDGIIARIIQHEYDHIEGKLFTDKLSSLKKRLLKNKLSDISKGIHKASYRVKVYHGK